MPDLNELREKIVEKVKKKLDERLNWGTARRELLEGLETGPPVATLGAPASTGARRFLDLSRTQWSPARVNKFIEGMRKLVPLPEFYPAPEKAREYEQMIDALETAVKGRMAGRSRIPAQEFMDLVRAQRSPVYTGKAGGPALNKLANAHLALDTPYHGLQEVPRAMKESKTSLSRSLSRTPIANELGKLMAEAYGTGQGGKVLRTWDEIMPYSIDALRALAGR